MTISERKKTCALKENMIDPPFANISILNKVHYQITKTTDALLNEI